MPVSKIFVQLGLRYNWRISMLKVLHASNLLCAAVFIIRAGFRSPFSSLPNRVLVAGGKPKPSKHNKKILEKKTSILNFLRFFFGWVTGSSSLIGVRSDPCCSMQSNAKHPQWAGYSRGSIPNSSGYAGFPAIVYTHGVVYIPPIGADR